MSPLRRMTLKELAEMASVTPSTVSRVLNDPTGTDTKWASPETAQRIIDLARETGYAKNPHAASLRTKRSGLLGVMFPRLSDYVYSSMYEGIDEFTTEHDLFTMVTTGRDDPELRQLRVNQLLGRRVDGIILGDAQLDDPIAAELQERGFPLVLMNRRSSDIVTCSSDDHQGGYLMGEHFLRQGYDSIAIITAGEPVSTSVDRQDGMLSALRDNGFDMSRVTVIEGGFDVAGGERAMTELFERGDVPRAVFAVNDPAAFGAMGIIRSRGLMFPGDVAVAGYNDTSVARTASLTTVRTPMHDIGFKAVELLDQVIRKQPVESVLLPVELVVRETA